MMAVQQPVVVRDGDARIAAFIQRAIGEAGRQHRRGILNLRTFARNGRQKEGAKTFAFLLPRNLKRQPPTESSNHGRLASEPQLPTKDGFDGIRLKLVDRCLNIRQRSIFKIANLPPKQPIVVFEASVGDKCTDGFVMFVKVGRRPIHPGLSETRELAGIDGVRLEPDGWPRYTRANRATLISRVEKWGDVTGAIVRIGRHVTVVAQDIANRRSACRNSHEVFVRELLSGCLC